MKISEFAKRFGIGVITVRYYVSCGLLLPEIQNKQFRFNERCVKDMEMILLLKRFDFSISEILNLLSLTRLSNLTATDDVADFVRLLETQQQTLEEKLLQSELAIRDLEKYINTVKTEHGAKIASPLKKKGVPIEMLSLICCPDCQSPLSLQGADIQGGEVIRADVGCHCGYHATIQNGILITEGGTISELDSPDIDRKFYKDLPVSWVTLFQRSFNWMLAQYAAMDLKGKVVMENHINCYFFLFARLSQLDTGAYYIFCDKYHEIVTLFKELIEQQNLDLKILYIADSTSRYPLKKACIDLYVDYHSTNEFSIFDSERELFDILLPYLKPGADILGTYFYLPKNSRSHRKLFCDFPCCAPTNFLRSHFESVVQNCPRLSMVAQEEIGFVTEWGGQNINFTYHVKDDPMHLLSYWYRVK